ncbi:MAG TPA: 50S ribosomal protein L29 [archaeon]|nr:50S ribosomal protein L29 [archaeon]
MKAHEIREMTDNEIQLKLGELREEYFRLAFRNAVHKVDNPMRLRSLRKDIARCLTVLNQKEKEQQADQ